MYETNLASVLFLNRRTKVLQTNAKKNIYLVNYLLLSTQFAQIELGCGKSDFLLANQLLVNNRFQYLLQFICEVLILIGCKNKYCLSEGTRNVYFNAITETITAHISDFNQILLILGNKKHVFQCYQ